MIIEGLVTDVNEKLLCFEINRKTTVHMVLIFIRNPNQKLPRRGTEVKVESLVFLANEFKVKTLILCSESALEGNLSLTPQNNNNFVNIVKNLNLRAQDLLDVDINYKKLKAGITSPHLVTTEELLLSALVNLPKDHFHSRVRLKFTNQIRFVDKTPEKYNNLSYWTYGNHRNSSKNNKIFYLMGYLLVHRKYGIVCFTDFQRHIPCIIMNASRDIFKFINHYVLIKDYTVVTEIYNCHKFASLEYLIVDSKDIIILPLTCDYNRNFIFHAVPENFFYDSSLDIEIISKSMPLVNARGRLECWLHVIIEEVSHVLLCLNFSYTEVFPLLKQRSSYQLCFKGSLKETFNKEIRTANPSLPQYELPNDGIFIPSGATNGHSNAVMDVVEANQQLSSSKLVTFQGQLSVKKFANPLSSRTSKVVSDLNFGTPGTKTHLLEFNTGDTILTVYLNNWENSSIPYCLLPNTRLIVHNVLPQRGRYYKSTAMTAFEIVNYEPELPFVTANLCGGVDNGDWTSPYFFGAGSAIPCGVIICTRTTSFFILGLKVFYQCIKCEAITHFNKPCQNCRQLNQQLSATITLIVTDQMGESKVIAKGKLGMLLLRLLLNAQQPVFEKWCRGFEILNNYDFFKGKNPEIDEKILDGTASARKVLTKHFSIINEFGLCLDLKGRKMANEDNGNSVYFLLDVRRV